jgi:hypothetical protein
MRTPESNQERLARLAGQAFVAEERDRQVERRTVDEEQRQVFTSAKTAKLRALREARDAAARAPAPPKPERAANTRKLRAGVRLRKGGK